LISAFLRVENLTILPRTFVSPFFSRLHKKEGIALFLLLPAAALLFFAWTTTWAAEEDSISIIYPDIGEPYRQIFAQIIEGIQDKAGTPLMNYPLRSDTDIDMLRTSLLKRHTKVVIALGRQGMKAASMLNGGIEIVVGGVLTAPENETHGQAVMSLSPDPALLFARMKALMPATKRVFVVYDPSANAWLIKLAKEAAQTQGLQLVAHEAQDLRSAVRFYQQIFSAADGRSDVLWLPQDSTTVEESSVLPLVLRESWNQGIAVFSSTFSHVRRGVLFSLYPDNVALGKSLASLAQDMLVSGEDVKRGMMPLRDVQSAVNLRTAQHLGINPARHQGFDLTFPEQ
jgi:putative ABC transport system substrate-binding protein